MTTRTQTALIACFYHAVLYTLVWLALHLLVSDIVRVEVLFVIPVMILSYYHGFKDGWNSKE